MDPEAIGPEHLTALAYGQDAYAAMAYVCEEAARVIAHDHGLPGHEQETRGGKKPAYGVGYWSTVSLRALDPAWGERFLDWNLTVSQGGAPGIATGRVYVNAGLSSPRGRPVDSSWRAEAENACRGRPDPIQLAQWTDALFERLHRVAVPQDVLRGTTLEGQGASLGRWVSATFEAIRDLDPPPN